MEVGSPHGPTIFDQACFNVVNNKKKNKKKMKADYSGTIKTKGRKKRLVCELGKEVKISSSYYACITPRSETRGATVKRKGQMEKRKEVSEDPISNGDSFSISSIADYAIDRYNIRNVKVSEVGKNYGVPLKL